MLSSKLTTLTFLAIGLSTSLQADRTDLPASIPASGGRFFHQRVELPVTDFAQDDPRWGDEHLGPTTDTLADQGCTLTSVVMVLNYHHVRCDPSTLNRFLFHHDGYDNEGLLDFDRVVAFAPGRVRLDYRGEPSYARLDHNLLAGNPVIVQLTLYAGYRHFVVVMGKQGYDYLVRDPAADPSDSLVTLKSLSPRIEQQFVYSERTR